MSSIEKKLNMLSPGGTCSQLAFFPSAALLHKGKFKHFSRRGEEPV